MENSTTEQIVAYIRKNPSTVLATTAADGEPWVRAMWVARVDDDGVVWYATGIPSNKVAQLEANPRVCIAGTEGMHGFRLFGTAVLITEQAVKSALWDDSWTEYFGNKENENWGVLKITPGRGEAW